VRPESSFFAILPLLMACRQIVGIEQRQVFEPSCTACMTTNCRGEAEQCFDDSSCRCFQACAPGDSSCRLGCSKTSVPVSTVQALEDCRARSCADACGPWDCLGNVQWQIPNPFPATITIRASVRCMCSPILSTFANEGVRVRVCSVSDINCEDALASPRTRSPSPSSPSPTWSCARAPLHSPPS
jgi:hypothetical protein